MKRFWCLIGPPWGCQAFRFSFALWLLVFLGLSFNIVKIDFILIKINTPLVDTMFLLLFDTILQFSTPQNLVFYSFRPIKMALLLQISSPLTPFDPSLDRRVNSSVLPSFWVKLVLFYFAKSHLVFAFCFKVLLLRRPPVFVACLAWHQPFCFCNFGALVASCGRGPDRGRVCKIPRENNLFAGCVPQSCAKNEYMMEKLHIGGGKKEVFV